jgi:hypothetical protein
MASGIRKVRRELRDGDQMDWLSGVHGNGEKPKPVGACIPKGSNSGVIRLHNREAVPAVDFKAHPYWERKTVSAEPKFFCVHEVRKQPRGGVILVGVWCEQEADSYKFRGKDCLFIDESEFKDWQPYQPFGVPRL